MNTTENDLPPLREVLDWIFFVAPEHHEYNINYALRILIAHLDMGGYWREAEIAAEIIRYKSAPCEMEVGGIMFKGAGRLSEMNLLIMRNGSVSLSFPCPRNHGPVICPGHWIHLLPPLDP